MLKPKIFLVEDNKINTMVTRSMMKQLGHTIDVVNNGVEAVRAVQSCTYDLVLMVIFLELKNMTANALVESVDECFANGMDSFVSKPVTFQ
ncbi:Histidine kinase 5 [Camellia lanceoleosa]|uniref:Histidine kinase 5 n=1 Tax=Camellia lanceoleosa TaxID=1840588 RepID=A0ACC0H8D9_9ERIC|nr:Histidine kinase 5 [Camellia lanceoleosa]